MAAQSSGVQSPGKRKRNRRQLLAMQRKSRFLGGAISVVAVAVVGDGVVCLAVAEALVVVVVLPEAVQLMDMLLQLTTAHLRRLARQRPRLHWLPRNMTRRRLPAMLRLQHGSTHPRLCQRFLVHRLAFRRLAQLGLVLAPRRRGAVIPTSTARCRRSISVQLHQNPLKFLRLPNFHGLKSHGPKRSRLHHHLPRPLLLLLLLLLLLPLRYPHLLFQQIPHCHRLWLPNLNRILSILDGKNRQRYKRLPGTMSHL